MIDTSEANSRQEKVKIITDKLEQGIRDLMNSDNYKEYLTKMSKLHNYSFNNSVLILMQKPDATMVAGLTTFNKTFHRSVNKGEKGIVILAPAPFKKDIENPVFTPNGEPVIGMDGKQLTEKKQIEVQAFKPAYVFDVSQTHGEPVPTLGVDELSGNVDNYERVFEAVRNAAPVPVVFEQINSGAKGYYDSAEKKIVINEGMSQTQTLKTLIHETAHSMLHDNDYLKSTGEKKDRQTREVEAESVAYAVSSGLGVDTSEYSFGYIAGWAGSRKIDAVKESMETIRKCSSDIISSVERRLLPKQPFEAESQSQKHTKQKAIAV